MLKSHGEGRSRTALGILLEVTLVAIGVFLGLLASSWHENREHQALARQTLQNFSEEIELNEHAVEEKRKYHTDLAADLRKFLEQPGPHTLPQLAEAVHFRGMQPVTFEHTAWDLALATQALPFLKPDDALAISRVYTAQNFFQTLQTNFGTSMYTSLSNPEVTGLATSMSVYMTDVNLQEPKLLEAYKGALAQLHGSR
jgi:hypothetical protein